MVIGGDADLDGFRQSAFFYFLENDRSGFLCGDLLAEN